MNLAKIMPSLFPWKDTKGAIVRFQEAAIAAPASKTLSIKPQVFSKRIVGGASNTNPTRQISPSELSGFLEELDGLASDREFNELVKSGTSTALDTSGHQMSLSYYAALLAAVHSHEHDGKCIPPTVTTRMASAGKNDVHVAEFNLPFGEKENAKPGKVIFVNGQMVVLDDFPIKGRAKVPS